MNFKRTEEARVNKRSIFFPFGGTIDTLTVLKMQIFDIFESNVIVSELNLFALKISPASGTQFFLTKVTDKQFQKLRVATRLTKLRPTLRAQVHLQTREQLCETCLLSLCMVGL